MRPAGHGFNLLLLKLVGLSDESVFLHMHEIKHQVTRKANTTCKNDLELIEGGERQSKILLRCTRTYCMYYIFSSSRVMYIV